MKEPRPTPQSLALGLITVPVLSLFILACNILQILSLAVYPFSPSLFRAFNRNIARAWWELNYHIYFGLYRPILGQRFYLTGHEAFPLKENAIVIANHQSMTDIMAIMALAKVLGSAENGKFFAKNILKYIPGIGWGMHFLNFVFLKRNWTHDAGTVLKTFATLRNNKIPFFLVNFPEGTRATPAKLVLSQNFARQNNMPLLENVMVPRTKGVVSTVQGLENHFDAFYDLTIAYGNPKPPNLMKFFFCETAPIHLHAERFAATELPKDELVLAKWLHERFRIKDARLKKFRETGRF